MKSNQYSVEQLIHNPSFRRTVYGTAGTDEIQKWNSWIESSNENREKARKAAAQISGFIFKNDSCIDVDDEWNRLQESIRAEKDVDGTSPRKVRTPVQWIYRVAAALLMAGMVGAGVYFFSMSEQSPNQLEQITKFRTIETGPGERKTLEFSNGSKIEINSNTRLSSEISSVNHETIEVKLDGEAFFESGNNPSTVNPSFEVKTPDGIVRDIGTKFLVRVQNNHSEVILEEGSVDIRQMSVTDTTDIIKMKKGEMISFNGSYVKDRKIVNTTFHTSWATGFLQFDETPLISFAHYLEERFDVDVQILDPALKNNKLDGGIYFYSLAELVRSVSKVLEFPAKQSHDKQSVYFGNK